MKRCQSHLVRRGTQSNPTNSCLFHWAQHSWMRRDANLHSTQKQKKTRLGSVSSIPENSRPPVSHGFGARFRACASQLGASSQWFTNQGPVVRTCYFALGHINSECITAKRLVGGSGTKPRKASTTLLYQTTISGLVRGEVRWNILADQRVK